jgi:hypothetical protein
MLNLNLKSVFDLGNPIAFYGPMIILIKNKIFFKLLQIGHVIYQSMRLDALITNM